MADGSDCDVYWASVAQLRPRHVALLDSDEVDRRESYRQAQDRDRFTLGAVLLRLVMARRSCVPPESLTVDRTCTGCGAPHGRPRVSGHGVDVSVAHSGDYAAVAVSTAGPVGVDVESMRPREYVPIIRALCAPEERACVVSHEAFYAYWTRKEALLKAAGVGLAVPMQHLWVSSPTQSPRVLRAPDGIPLTSAMADVSPARGYAGAVAVLTEAPVAFRSHHACLRRRGTPTRAPGP